MPKVLRLTVLTGPHKNEKFCFCGPTRCLIGRAGDCFVQLAGMPRDGLISRHHCELVIAPPVFKLNDLGSQNGTFINGSRVESVELRLTLKADGAAADAEPFLNQGDLLTTGGTTFRMDVVECPPRDKVVDKVPLWEEGGISVRRCPIQCT